MANMSYCRHQNTLQDLLDVIEKFDDFNPDDYDKSDPELKAYRKLEKLINWDEV